MLRKIIEAKKLRIFYLPSDLVYKCLLLPINMRTVSDLLALLDSINFIDLITDQEVSDLMLLTAPNISQKR